MVLGYQREDFSDQMTLVIKGNDLRDERENLDDQRKDLHESKAAMPKRVKQTGIINTEVPFNSTSTDDCSSAAILFPWW